MLFRLLKNIWLWLLLSLILFLVLACIRESLRGDGSCEDSGISIMEPTNECGVMRPSLNSQILNGLILESNSDVSPKGDIAFCGRSLYNGKPIYFVVKHRNYTGPEDKIINGPFFWVEKEVESYVKRIDSGLQIKRCPCGCWERLDNKRHFVSEVPCLIELKVPGTLNRVQKGRVQKGPR